MFTTQPSVNNLFDAPTGKQPFRLKVPKRVDSLLYYLSRCTQRCFCNVYVDSISCIESSLNRFKYSCFLKVKNSEFRRTHLRFSQILKHYADNFYSIAFRRALKKLTTTAFVDSQN